MANPTHSLILILLLSIFIGCSSSFDVNSHHAKKNTINSFSREDSILRSKPFIADYELLSDSCFVYLKNKIENFYLKSEKDSLIKIYAIDAHLYKPHYTTDESKKVKKFACFMRRHGKEELVFFGIDKKMSDYLWLNELSITNLKPFLTKEEHYRWNADFSFLADCDCPLLNKIDSTASLENNRNFSLGTFEHNSDYKWVVDSILMNNAKKSIFSENDTFQVHHNSQMKFDDYTIDYYFDYWHIYFIKGQDTIPSKMVSFGNESRIIVEESESAGKPMVFMTRLPEN